MRGQLERRLEVLFGIRGIGTISQFGQHAADLVDDFSVIQTQRSHRFGVFGFHLQGLVQRFTDLARQTLGQRLGDRDRLAQTAHRKRTPVVAVGQIGQGGHSLVGEANQIFIATGLGVIILDQIRGMDSSRLDRHRRTECLQHHPGFIGLLKIATMKIAPGILQLHRNRSRILAKLGIGLEQGCNMLLIGVGLLIAQVQLRPGLGQLVAGIVECLVLVRKRRPVLLSHHPALNSSTRILHLHRIRRQAAKLRGSNNHASGESQ